MKATHLHSRLAAERQERLRSLIREQGVLSILDACEKLDASQATVRRDLDTLESQGLVRRVHGGAVSVQSRIEEPLFDDKASIAAKEKRRIAEAAAELIEQGDAIYLDGGSTVLELARILAARSDLTVFTNSLRAAIELSGRGPRLMLIGGQLRRLSQTMVGTLTTAMLGSINVQKAFMGTVALSPDRGLTTTDPDEAFTKNMVLSRAESVIVLADAGKIGKVALSQFGRIGDIDILVTDKRADKTILGDLRKKGIKIIVS